jgi:hypothetical protein
LEPGDLDVLVRGAGDVERIASAMPSVADEHEDDEPARFLSTERRPLLVFGGGSWVLRRWSLGDVKLEVAYIRTEPSEHSRLLETAGALIWAERDLVELGASRGVVGFEVRRVGVK